MAHFAGTSSGFESGADRSGLDGSGLDGLGLGDARFFRINKRYVYLLSAIAALGGILFGFDLVIISGTVGFFQAHFGLNELETGWAVGCINLGAAIGAIMGGWLCERLGRKKLLMICAILFAVTGGGTGWAENFPMS